MRQAREAWKAERQPKMGTEPHRLVFIDETGTNTKMTRARGRCERGERLRSKAPFGHWKTQTFVAGLRCGALTAPWVIDAPMDRAIFETYVRTQLVPTTPDKEIVHWDQALPGFGLKMTPKGRKVFVVLYRAGGGGSRLRKYTIGPYGRITLHNARIQAVLVARLEGRDPAAEKLEARRRLTADTVAEVAALYGKLHLSQRRSGRELLQILQRDLVKRLGSRSVHSISKRDIIDVVSR